MYHFPIFNFSIYWRTASEHEDCGWRHRCITSGMTKKTSYSGRSLSNMDGSSYTATTPMMLEEENEWVDEEVGNPRSKKLRKGDRVYACWLGKDAGNGSWYPGIIKGSSDDNHNRMYHVKFDDGDDDAKLTERYVVPEDSYQSCAGAGESESLASESEEKVTKSKEGLEAFNRWVLKKGYVHNLQKGDPVYACWLEKDSYEGHWFPGTIVDANKGYYQVKFREGGLGKMLSDCHVMPFDRMTVAQANFRAKRKRHKIKFMWQKDGDAARK